MVYSKETRVRRQFLRSLIKQRLQWGRNTATRTHEGILWNLCSLALSKMTADEIENLYSGLPSWLAEATLQAWMAGNVDARPEAVPSAPIPPAASGSEVATEPATRPGSSNDPVQPPVDEPAFDEPPLTDETAVLKLSGKT